MKLGAILYKFYQVYYTIIIVIIYNISTVDFINLSLLYKGTNVQSS